MTNKLIARLAVMFGPADFSDDPRAFLSEIARLTKSYSEEVLDKAADLLIRSHRPTQLKPWPSPSEICVACADAQEMVAPSSASNPLAERNQDWTKEALDRADRLIQSDIGRKAADEGWILGLWDHYRKTTRQPTAKEIIAFKNKAYQFDHAYKEALTNGTCRSLGLPRLGDAILARRGQKVALTNGEFMTRAEVAKMLQDRITGERREGDA